MIPTNLKVGDRFTDGGRTFEVTAVNELGYESRDIDMPVSEQDVKEDEPEEEIKELPFTTVEEKQLDSFNKYTKTEINRLNNAELKSVCEKLDLNPGTGVEMKKAIIEKLGL